MSSSPGKAISYPWRAIFRGCVMQGRKTAKGSKSRIENRSHHLHHGCVCMSFFIYLWGLPHRGAYAWPVSGSPDQRPSPYKSEKNQRRVLYWSSKRIKACPLSQGGLIICMISRFHWQNGPLN
jgi:hypothetical protein